MRTKYILKHFETGEVITMTLKEVLGEINRDRSSEWQDYDSTDWEEGLAMFTEYTLIGKEAIK